LSFRRPGFLLALRLSYHPHPYRPFPSFLFRLCLPSFSSHLYQLAASFTHSWLYGPDVINEVGYAIYNPTLSLTSFIDLTLNQNFHITYAWGWGAAGYAVKKTVSVGASGNAVMNVGVATAVNQTQANTAEDGIVGLGFLQENTSKSSPEVPNLFLGRRIVGSERTLG